ncbi:serine/threonine-protein kinase HipA [Dyella sp. SG562]|uniref:type II toxin-antitoxin system HipA family toxin n=2 Tax=Rhodanobacteraceae TaxID=1775411 RepID=UPI0017DBDB1B|nr:MULTISPECIES: type II toxin-antitoxin system HipA family toxin [unclassified Dyella]NII72236.1 serine/threonine-protein kinase HipA [Dyella sp. SG562]NKJ22562.1 serine/threonine-protein kinase HipA [Dyella sp. SG609]
MAMFNHVDAIEVRIWNKLVGAVSPDHRHGAYAFEYAPAWIKRGVELAPLTMPLAEARQPFLFPHLREDTYKRLPGLLADALPDDFGSALIDAYMATRGVDRNQITSLDRLAYMGRRGMGALEFHPARGITRDRSGPLQMAELVRVARDVLHGDLTDDTHSKEALASIIRVGTSAGGARAKAVVAFNPETRELRSGQFHTATGFEHWLIKFDGLGEDTELGQSQAHGRIEYAYYLMATAAGITMSECRLLHENGRRHFMTKRFDRDGNSKHHMQTLCGLDHIDYKMRDTNSYEQLFLAMNRLGLDLEARQQAFRRMVFNWLAWNCDDHSKNHSFLLREEGAWELSPAYDITFAHNPDGYWTRHHLMSVAGKFDGADRADFMKVADVFQIADASAIMKDVQQAVAQWTDFARQADVPPKETGHIASYLLA